MRNKLSLASTSSEESWNLNFIFGSFESCSYKGRKWKFLKRKSPPPPPRPNILTVVTKYQTEPKMFSPRYRQLTALVKTLHTYFSCPITRRFWVIYNVLSQNCVYLIKKRKKKKKDFRSCCTGLVRAGVTVG